MEKTLHLKATIVTRKGHCGDHHQSCPFESKDGTTCDLFGRLLGYSSRQNECCPECLTSQSE